MKFYKSEQQKSEETIISNFTSLVNKVHEGIEEYAENPEHVVLTTDEFNCIVDHHMYCQVKYDYPD